MAGLTYVGLQENQARGVETRESAEVLLNAGVSRAYVQDVISAQKAAKATKVYVDTQDETYALSAYYPAQDALLVPNAAKGTAGGVASLDSGTPPKIPVAQVPVLGSGMLRGPYGVDSTTTGTTGATPLKIAQWDLGVIGYTGQPLVWANLSCQSIAGRPVIEVRAGESTDTAYVDQTLIARGVGRSLFDDYQMVTVFPCTATDGEGQDGVQDSWPSTTNWLVNMWMFDDSGGQVTITSGLVYTAALFIARTTL